MKRKPRTHHTTPSPLVGEGQGEGDHRRPTPHPHPPPQGGREGFRIGSSHFDEDGQVHMVDVGEKPVTRRLAIARGFVKMLPSTLRVLQGRRVPKGDVFTVAKLAGTLAAKRVDELIPFCHPLSLDHVEIVFEVRKNGVAVQATAECQAKTGVEMEALTACAVTCLTIYDMCKALDQGMVIGDIHLEKKTGGRSGTFFWDKKGHGR